MIRYPPLCCIEIGERWALVTIDFAETSLKEPRAGLFPAQLG